MHFMDYIANKNGALKSARISIPEMRKSTEKVVQMVQRQYFSEEIECLTVGHQGTVSQSPEIIRANFGSMLQCPLYLGNAEVLSHQILQSACFFLH